MQLWLPISTIKEFKVLWEDFPNYELILLFSIANSIIMSVKNALPGSSTNLFGHICFIIKDKKLQLNSSNAF